jgi:Zn-dependent M16 (insulinase) family peptidase
LPEKLRIFVPVFKDLFQNIGTKNYNYEQFNNKLMNSTNGLEISIDKFSHSDDIFDRNDQFLIETSFLDRNIDDAFDCLSEILATPNFDEQDNISDLIRLESVSKA